MQLIGLQLWLPTFFVILFCFCYVFAFHSPTAHNVPVAVVGNGQTTSALAAGLETQFKGALDVSSMSSLAAAKEDVRSGELAAAYVPGTSTATLYVASAAQYQLATLAKSYFTPVAAAQKVTLNVSDVAPLPASDSFGTSLFYMTLVLMISGYMVAMFVGMMGAGLRHRVRLGILTGMSIFLPLLSTLIVRFVLHVVDAHFFELWAIGAFTAFTVGLVVNGIAYFAGRFVAAFALAFFVFANVPASGGAFPPELMPEPFRFLHDYVSGTGTIDLLRNAVYGVGPGAWAGARILLGYLIAGVILTVIGAKYAKWVQNRRVQRGTPPSMLVMAQRAATALAAANYAAAVEKRDANTSSIQVIGERNRADEEEAKASEFSTDESDADATAAVTGAEV